VSRTLAIGVERLCRTNQSLLCNVLVQEADMTNKFHPRSVGVHGGTPPRHTIAGIGKVDALASTGQPAIRTPSDLDIYNAIYEVSQKLLQLSKNQQILDAKLDHIASRLDAANANVIMGVQYLGRMEMATEWLIAGDYDASTESLPKHLPHWQ
jgi:hypothetical protein